jgi:hypothetical protein
MTHCQRPFCPPVAPIICRPKKIYRDYCHPQPVQVVQPVEIINRHHCVPVYQHCYTYETRDEFCGHHHHGHHYHGRHRRRRRFY